MPLLQQRTVSQFKTRPDAQRKRAGRKALPKRIAVANVARPGIATSACEVQQRDFVPGVPLGVPVAFGAFYGCPSRACKGMPVASLWRPGNPVWLVGPAQYPRSETSA